MPNAWGKTTQININTRQIRSAESIIQWANKICVSKMAQLMMDLTEVIRIWQVRMSICRVAFSHSSIQCRISQAQDLTKIIWVNIHSFRVDTHHMVAIASTRESNSNNHTITRIGNIMALWASSRLHQVLSKGDCIRKAHQPKVDILKVQTSSIKAPGIMACLHLT